MLDTTELVHLLTSPPALSPDTPTELDNLLAQDLLVTRDLTAEEHARFFQNSEDLMEEDDEDLDDLLPPWEDDTVD